MRFKWAFLLVGIWAVARFCHHQTDGFRMSKLIDNSSPFAWQIPTPLAEDEKVAIDALLSQRFTYLARGKQSFAFVSEDGQTVLKLFNNRLHRRAKWLRSEKAKQKLDAVFTSYQLADERLKEETGLLYFHPQAGDDRFPNTKLIDRLGIVHEIDLNHCGFLLQKRAVLAYDYLKGCKGDEERKAAVIAIVELMRAKMDIGIADHDPLVRANIGFSQGQPIQIDVGPLSENPELKDLEKQREELTKMTLGFKHWLEANYPELTSTLHEAIK